MFTALTCEYLGRCTCFPPCLPRPCCLHSLALPYLQSVFIDSDNIKHHDVSGRIHWEDETAYWTGTTCWNRRDKVRYACCTAFVLYVFISTSLTDRWYTSFVNDWNLYKCLIKTWDVVSKCLLEILILVIVEWWFRALHGGDIGMETNCLQVENSLLLSWKD